MAWLTSPWIVLIGLALGILGPITGYLFYRWSIKEWKPQYAVLSFTLVHEGISDHIPNLKFHYTGASEPLRNFTICKLLFINAGTAPIRKTDLAKDEPIMISTKQGATILDAEIIQKKEESNRYEITKKEDKVRVALSFEYMAPGEGVVIQLYHTGTWSDHIEVKGKLVDGKRPKPVSFAMPFRRQLRVRRLLPLLIVAIGIVAINVVAYVPYFADNPRNIPIFVAGTFLGISFMLGYQMGILYRPGRRPKGFDAFHEGF